MGDAVRIGNRHLALVEEEQVSQGLLGYQKPTLTYQHTSKLSRGLPSMGRIHFAEKR